MFELYATAAGTALFLADTARSASRCSRFARVALYAYRRALACRYGSAYTHHRIRRVRRDLNRAHGAANVRPHYA